MDSFSQRDRFVWRDNEFQVIIPNGTRTACYPRASPSYLKALLIPQLRLTRGGNISLHQPTPPPPQPYEFYLAQLIHYGLDFHFDIEAAQRALEIQLRLGRLRVPPGLVKLEKDLRREHDREQKKLHEQVVRYSGKQHSGSNIESSIPVNKSEPETEDERKQTPAPRRSEKRKKNRVPENGPKENAGESSSEERSSTESDPGEDSDTIAVAPDSTSSSGASSSSSSPSPSPARSSQASRKVKRSQSISSSESSSDKSSNPSDNGKASGDDDPFVDRHDVKRIKLEQAEEREDSIARSTREAAPFVDLKVNQIPPSQAKVRRIAFNPQISTPSRNLGTSTPSTTTTNEPVKKSFFTPDRRPSWTIPVRSPSSAQKDTTPKSVTFSQVQRETPTKVPQAEKATFSSVLLKTPPQASPYGTTLSTSSNHSLNQTTPLRSILKRSPSNFEQGFTSTNGGSRAEISVQIPREGDGHVAKRRRRKRRSGGLLDGDFGGPRQSLGMTDGPNEEKPFITSDIVDGKPVSVLSSKNSSSRAGAFRHGYDNSKGDTNFLPVNSKAYQHNQRNATQQRQVKHTFELDKPNEYESETEFDSPPSPEKRVIEEQTQKHNPIVRGSELHDHPHLIPIPAPGPLNLNANPSAKKQPKRSSGKDMLKAKESSLGSARKVGSGSGSRSRGSLVRAGRVY